MTLDDLKTRATAAEMALIEATEDAVRDDVVREIRKSVLGFINTNPPPRRDDQFFEQSTANNGLARLDKHLNPDA